MRKTLSNTTQYLNSIKPVNIPGFFLACVFLGWNGVQILFSLGLILTFIDTKSMTNLILNSMRYNTRSIPLYLFTLGTLFLIHWLIHCYMEAALSAKIQKTKLNFTELKAITINFFIPNFLIVISVFFIIGTIFLFITFGQIVASGFEVSTNLSYEYYFYRWLNLSISISIFFTMVLTDHILPRMLKYHTFKGAGYRAIIHFRDYSHHFIYFYLFKLLLIIVSVFVFQSILRHFILPYFLMLEDKYSIVVFMSSGRFLNFGHIFSNIAVIFGMLITSLIIFTPIMAPLYIYQRLLIYKWFNF